MKCSIMVGSADESLWQWEQNVSGTLTHCIDRLISYQQSAKHGQLYILVEELPTTTAMLDGAKDIKDLNLIDFGVLNGL